MNVPPYTEATKRRIEIIDMEVKALQNEAFRVQQTAQNLLMLRDDLVSDIIPPQYTPMVQVTKEEEIITPETTEEDVNMSNAFEDAVEYLDASARRHEEDGKRFYYPRSVTAFPVDLRCYISSSVGAIVRVVKCRRTDRRRRNQHKATDEPVI